MLIDTFRAVFILAPARSGGSFVSSCFSAEDSVDFGDLLNPRATLPRVIGKLARQRAGLGHPESTEYFQAIRSFTKLSRFQRAASLWSWKGTDSPRARRAICAAYARFGTSAAAEGKTPIFRIENPLHFDLLRSTFPSSTFVGVVRDSDERLGSYLAQALRRGNLFFFLRDYFLHGQLNRQRGFRQASLYQLMKDPEHQLMSAFFLLDDFSVQETRRNADVILDISNVWAKAPNKVISNRVDRKGDLKVEHILSRGLRIFQKHLRLPRALFSHGDAYLKVPKKNLRTLLALTLVRRGRHLASVFLLLLLGPRARLTRRIGS